MKTKVLLMVIMFCAGLMSMGQNKTSSSMGEYHVNMIDNILFLYKKNKDTLEIKYQELLQKENSINWGVENVNPVQSHLEELDYCLGKVSYQEAKKEVENFSETWDLPNYKQITEYSEANFWEIVKKLTSNILEADFLYQIGFNEETVNILFGIQYIKILLIDPQKETKAYIIYPQQSNFIKLSHIGDYSLYLTTSTKIWSFYKE